MDLAIPLQLQNFTGGKLYTPILKKCIGNFDPSTGKVSGQIPDSDEADIEKAHARKIGNLFFLSGVRSRQASDNQIPGLELDGEGNILNYDIEAECHSVFANVKAVLEASGSSRDKIADVTVFLTNMKVDFPAYNKIYEEYFKGVEACRTTVEVKSLPTPVAIELKVIATI